MSMQRLKNAVIKADALGLQLKLRPDGVEIIGRYGIESWRRIVGWTEIDGAVSCPITIHMETIAREIMEARASMARMT
jgi:hypothetical protein